MAPDVLVRPMAEADLGEVQAIQAANHEAAAWDPADYLGHQTRVAASGGRIRGFLVWREVAPGEVEILNLAVDPAWKRKGVASRLLDALPSDATVYLEVRGSNSAARAFYERNGFREAGRRPGYYRNPDEDGLILVRVPGGGS